MGESILGSGFDLVAGTPNPSLPGGVVHLPLPSRETSTRSPVAEAMYGRWQGTPEDTHKWEI
jgi:hypothetical protein